MSRRYGKNSQCWYSDLRKFNCEITVSGQVILGILMQQNIRT